MGPVGRSDDLYAGVPGLLGTARLTARGDITEFAVVHCALVSVSCATVRQSTTDSTRFRDDRQRVEDTVTVSVSQEMTVDMLRYRSIY